jgi:hypothetical protein
VVVAVVMVELHTPQIKVLAVRVAVVLVVLTPQALCLLRELPILVAVVAEVDYLQTKTAVLVALA